jgi:pentatricopeptide repeat protein
VVNKICPNVVTYNTLNNGNIKKGNLNESLELLAKMEVKGLHANVHTYNIFSLTLRIIDVLHKGEARPDL